MKGTYTHIISSVLLIISINSSQAATFMDLPDSVVSCPTCITSLIDIAPGSDGINPTAMYLKQDFISGEMTTLVGYSLYNAYELNFDIHTTLNGYLWLEGAMSYDLSSNQHDFTLYLDKITPAPTSPSSTSVDSAVVSLTTSDLLNGGGFFSSYEDTDLGIYSSNGDLITTGIDQIFVMPAISGISTIDVSFDLLYLDYYESGGFASVIPFLDNSDARTSVFSFISELDSGDPYWPAYYQEENFSVQPASVVPVPPAIWLFISGLVGMGFLRKNK